MGSSYYVKNYAASAWHTPYKVHETYDAVPETRNITGEGEARYLKKKPWCYDTMLA